MNTCTEHALFIRGKKIFVRIIFAALSIRQKFIHAEFFPNYGILLLLLLLLLLPPLAKLNHLLKSIGSKIPLRCVVVSMYQWCFYSLDFEEVNEVCCRNIFLMKRFITRNGTIQPGKYFMITQEKAKLRYSLHQNLQLQSCSHMGPEQNSLFLLNYTSYVRVVE